MRNKDNRTSIIVKIIQHFNFKVCNKVVSKDRHNKEQLTQHK